MTKATREHLAEACRLIHEAITQLCHADHLNQSRHLENWLTERSCDKLESMLFADNSQAFVCLDNGKIVGISHIKKPGELTLCYVHPDSVGQGFGKLLLNAAEEQANKWQLKEITLISTTTAKPFYLAHGYKQYQDPIQYIGMPGYPLIKKLQVKLCHHQDPR